MVEQLERDSALQGTTLFVLLSQRHPDRYRPTQVRTFQRQIAAYGEFFCRFVPSC